MLDKLKKDLGTDGRDRGWTKKAVAGFFFGSIILVFVFLDFSPDQMGMSGGGVVAHVNNSSISIRDWRLAIQRMESQFGGANASLKSFIQGQALENLIDGEILYQKTKEAGLRVTQAEVMDTIVNIPGFQEDGRFQRSYYDRYLKYSKLSHGKFEKEIEKDLVIQRLRSTLNTSLLPSQSEVTFLQKAEQVQANLQFIPFSSEVLSGKLAKSLKKDPFKEDESGKLAKDAKSFYEQNTKKYTTEAQVKAQHILIKFKSGDSSSEQKALDKIQKIAKEAESKDFGKLAKKYSEDPGSKDKGGDLGYFAKGQMVAEFEKVAFSSGEGVISAPVKTPYGYHLIKVLGKKPEVTRSFDEVKNEIGRELLAKEMATEMIEQLSKELKAGKISAVKALVKKSQEKWQETGKFNLFSPSVPKIGENEDLLIKAFSLSKTEAYPKKLFIVDGKNYLVRYAEVETKKETPLPSRIETVQELAQDKGLDLFQRLRVAWKKSSKVERNEELLRQ